MRFHLFEFEDLEWFPDSVRRGMLDYLSFFLRSLNAYQPVLPLLKEITEKDGSGHILDLCSGGGGTVIQLKREFEKNYGRPMHVTLSDKFPNADAYREMVLSTTGDVSYYQESLDARNIPAELPGIYTMFSAAHHFQPEEMREILLNAEKNRKSIAIFDGGDKNLLPLLAILLLHPAAIALSSPFIRPFRISRLFFTYIIPLIPFCTVWDGLISIGRLYTPDQFQKMSPNLNPSEYRWHSGKLKHPLGFHIAYLYGFPL